MEVLKNKALVTASLGAGLEKEGIKAAADAFRDYIAAAYPYFKGEKAKDDVEMVAAMKKEVAKGPIQFQVATPPSPLQAAAKRLSMPDEYRKKLQDKVAQRKK